MDYNNMYNQSPEYPNDTPTPNSLSKASMYLGFVSIIFAVIGFSFTCCFPIILITSLLGILFGFFSRQRGNHFSTQAIVGLSCNTVALIFLIILSVYIQILMNSAAGQQLVTEFMIEFRKYMEAYEEFMR